MAIFTVAFKNGLDENGFTCEFPTDKLNTGGAMIEDFEWVESRVDENDETFAREVWEYQIDDSEAGQFANGLDETPSVITWSRKN